VYFLFCLDVGVTINCILLYNCCYRILRNQSNTGRNQSNTARPLRGLSIKSLKKYPRPLRGQSIKESIKESIKSYLALWSYFGGFYRPAWQGEPESTTGA